MPLALLTLALALAAPLPPDPTIPTDATTILMVQGQGFQMYTCTHQGAAYAWTFTAPGAKLLDMNTLEELGKHTAGPRWTWNDGSTVTGKTVQTYSPDPSSVPWLLLEATPSPAPGKLANVTRIRRWNTQGGIAPTAGCDATHVNDTSPVPYTATYTFYIAK